MIASERRFYIQRSLEEKGIINLKEVAKELRIAEITVRRDFEKMEADGLLKRVQGGAMLEDMSETAELTMKRKGSINNSAKAKVAEYAASLVKNGDCVFIDAGTSAAHMMEYLEQKRISIVTYNELVVKKLTKPIPADIYMVGGKYVPGFSMFAGAVAQEGLRNYHFDHAFLGCTSVEVKERMAYATDADSLAMKKIAMENAAKSYLLIDTTKLERRSFLCFTAIDAFELVICDNDGQLNHQDYPENFRFV